MKIAVLGTGIVGTTVASKLTSLGHQVMMGSRTADNPKALEWERSAGVNASAGTYASAARFGEVIFNCVSGAGTLEALNACGAENLDGKILVDIANPLDFSQGMPPSLFVSNTDSLGETIQRTFSGARVVKTLNTVSAGVMVNAGTVSGDHDMFVSGNDPAAKEEVVKILKHGFGWKSVLDLGDISAARVQEAYVPMWVRLFMTTGNPNFNIKVVR